MSDTTILEGPDGRLYEIPNHRLAEFAVPGERVAELRRRLAGAAAGDPHADAAPSASGPQTAAPSGHTALPPGHAAAPASVSVNPGGGVVLNFYFQGPPPAGLSAMTSAPGAPGVEGYHMTFDETGIPVNHTDMLWGDYIDKQGNPAVGWHSHDPITGNAQ